MRLSPPRLGAWAAAFLLGSCPAAAQEPLQPAELLQSVERALPLLEQARQDVARAAGEATEARGAFDLSLKATGKSVRGFYDNERLGGLFEQPLAALGLTVFGGYRAGRGVFAPYDSEAQTLSDGEVSGGFQLPLLRDRAIDSRRTARQVADLRVAVSERALDKARLVHYKDALREYWDWVAAGEQRRVAQALLALAEARDQQLADSVALGQVAPVERTDNSRAILQRRSALASAVRHVEMKAIDVSLYYRSLTGQPQRPSSARLPALPRPAPDRVEPDEAAAVRQGLARRPELQALRLERSQFEVELSAAENAALPRLDVFSEASRDFGRGAQSRAGSSFEAGVTLQFPLQNRKASGKQAQARAKLAGIDAEVRWAEDQVRADVQDALSALRAAGAVLDVVSEELAVTRELEALERERFALGDSTQFLVNLRELATADAALREARALADYQKAQVLLEAATGGLLDRVPRP